eukprot:g2697.t1
MFLPLNLVYAGGPLGTSIKGGHWVVIGIDWQNKAIELHDSRGPGKADRVSRSAGLRQELLKRAAATWAAPLTPTPSGAEEEQAQVKDLQSILSSDGFVGSMATTRNAVKQFFLGVIQNKVRGTRFVASSEGWLGSRSARLSADELAEKIRTELLAQVIADTLSKILDLHRDDSDRIIATTAPDDEDLRSSIAENAGRFERRHNPALSEAERGAAPRITGIFCKCPRCFTPAEEFDLYDIDVRGRKLSSLRVAFLHMREIKQAAAAGQLAPLVTEAMQKKDKFEPPADSPPAPPVAAGAPAGPVVPAPPPVPAPVAADSGPCPPKKRLVGRDGSLIDLPVGLTATGRNGDRILVSVPAHAFSRTINPSTFNTDAGAVQAATRLRAQVIRDPLAFSRRSRGSL